jgi:hypothetical protein
MTPVYTATFSATDTPTPTITCTQVPIVGDYNLSGGTATLDPGLYNFKCVNITNGAALTINGGVTILCECFNLDAGCTITGKARGCCMSYWSGLPTQPGPGEGGGGAVLCGLDGLINVSGGGGHGGAGGGWCPPVCGAGLITQFYDCAPGGVANDDPVLPTQMGSAGAPDNYNDLPPYGAGGGLLKLVVYDPVGGTLAPSTVNGTIDMSGGEGNAMAGHTAGGGAGGAILIESSSVDGTGALLADGARGASWGTGGGGGGGGIISLIENLTTFAGTASVAPGGAGDPTPPQPGIVTFTAAPVTGYY